MRNLFLATSALSTAFAAMMVVATPAIAQDVAAEEASSEGVGDIVVTAQRRSESLQKAAIAIDAVTGEGLLKQGITNAGEITKSIPAITVANNGGSGTSIFMRGVGNVTTSSWNDPAVTPSYDGVVLGRAAGAFGAAFYDLARVEVLKGPQGILYGRNATGGAINIIPVRPVIGETSAGITLGVGNFGALSAEGHANIATSDTSALRIAGTRLEHDGYNRDGTDDEDTKSLRAQYLVEPSADLTLRLGADYTKVGGKGAGGSYIGNYNPGLVDGVTPDQNGYSFDPAPFDASEGFNTDAANAWRETVLGAPGFGFLNAMNTTPSVDFTYWGVNAEATLKTGIGTVTIIPAYRVSDGTSYFNGPAFNTAYTDETDKQASLEARLAGSAGKLDYVLGGFYFHEKIRADNEYNQEFVLPIQSYTQKTDSAALFGQLTAHVTDQFRLIGGLRYTHDKKNMDGQINNFITFCGGVPPVTPPGSFEVGDLPGGCANPDALPRYPNFISTADTLAWLKDNGWIAEDTPDITTHAHPDDQVVPLLNGMGAILMTNFPVVDKGTYSRLTWKLSGEYDLSPDNLVYATVETGYRAGGFQLAEGKSAYNPEFITAYSVGSKNRFLDNKLQLNFEGFFWQYKDQQITYFTVDTSGTLISSNENAGKAEIKGFDIDAIVKPTRSTTLSAKVQYLDAKYKDLHLYTASPRDNINCPFEYVEDGNGDPVLAGGAPVKDFNCSGNPLLYSPKWTLNLGAEQVVPLGADFELTGSIRTAWRDAQYGAFEYLPQQKIPAYWTTDLGLTLASTTGGWSLSGYVNNLEDKRRMATPQRSPIGVAIAHYGAPRTYGLRLAAEF